MLRTFLYSKIHGAEVTKADLNYQGSITIDKHLLLESQIAVYEQVHVLNISNGERFVTYVIEGAENSGSIEVNGAAARLAQEGDRLIILAYTQLETKLFHQPKILILGKDNQIKNNDK